MQTRMNEELRNALALMDRQYGVAHRRQLRELGLSAATIDAQLRNGRWEEVCQAVYRAAGGGTPPQQHLMAAVLQCGEGARLTAESVLALLGVEGFSLDEPPVVLMPRTRWLDVEFRIHRVPEPSKAEQATVCGIPGVTPTRALLDLARRRRGRALRVAVDAVRRQNLTTPQRLLDRALAAGRAHGASAVVEAVLSGSFRHESEPERMMAALFHSTQPPLDFQATLLDGVRVDAVWHDVKLVLEYDGRDRHTLPTDVEHDERRERRLREAGYEVVRIRWEDLSDPAGLRARILAIRQARLTALATA